MKKLSLFLLSLLFMIPSFGQEDALARIQMLERDSQYYTGKGIASTREGAIQSAMDELAKSISVSVTSDYIDNTKVTNGEVDQKIKMNTQIRAYVSNLQHVRKIEAQEQQGKNLVHIVLCYVKEEDVENMFQEQGDIIIDYITQAQKKEYNKEVGYAISDYYKALALLCTSPIAHSLEYTDYNNNTSMAINFINNQLINIFKAITVEVASADPANNSVSLCFKYKNEVISGHLLFDYYDPSLYENFENRQANNGYASLSFNSMPEKLDLAIGYHDLTNVRDESVRSALKSMGKQNFTDAKKQISVKRAIVALQPQQQPKAEPLKAESQEQIYTDHAAKFTPSDNQELKEILHNLEQAIKTKQYANVQKHFTPEGYNRWQALVRRGTASMIKQPSYTFLKLDSTIYCRGMKLQFTFPNNFRPIVEDVCFRFNENKQIQSLAFGLSKSAEEDILTDSKQWSDTAKIVLLSFLEDYKTAYALKDIQYLESVFSNDALIITGTVLKPTKKRIDFTMPSLGETEKRTIYKVRSKEEYIAHLKTNFAGKRWINIMFEDVDVKRRIIKDSDLYGIQVKQNYFSSNYGDEGYLSLLVDMGGEKPVIYVRVWQEDKVKEFSAETIANKPGLALDLGK